MLGIVAWSRLIAGLVRIAADPRKSVSVTNLGFLAGVIAIADLSAPVSNEGIRPGQAFREFSVILKTVIQFAQIPGSQVVAGHYSVMGVYDLVQRQCERRRSNSLCLFLPPTVDRIKLVFGEEARFRSDHMVSESQHPDALTLTGNGATTRMNVQSRSAVMICDLSRATFETDCNSLGAHFGLPYDVYNECRCWRQIGFLSP